MIVVVRTPRGQAAEALVRSLLPSRAVLVTPTVSTSDDTPVEAFAFRDSDGKLLTEYRTFPSLEAARGWVSDDADRRHAKAGRPS